MSTDAIENYLVIIIVLEIMHIIILKMLKKRADLPYMTLVKIKILKNIATEN